MRKSLAASLVLISTTTLLSAAEPVWLTSYTNALHLAKEQKKPVLVEFTADWCHYCKVMEKSTMKEPVTLTALQPFLLLKVDYDKEPNLVRQFGVQGVPAFFVVSEHGAEAARTSGFQPAADFVKWLQEGQESVRKQNDLRERMEVERRQLDAALASKEEKGLKEAAETVFFWAAMEKLETRNLARDYLIKLAEVKPVLVLEGMVHTSLAVRIASANALQRRFGKVFDIDPWADAASRQKALVSWRSKVSTGK